MGEKVQGLRNRNWSVWNRQRDANVKNSEENGVTKELTCMIQ